MIHTLALEGLWQLQLDEHKEGVRLPLCDTIQLPGTTSHAKKGKRNHWVEIGSLTDEYCFEGYAWFARDINISEELAGKKAKLFLERTRVTTVWLDDIELGTCNSLTTPHVYELISGLTAGKHRLLIRVDNTDYPTKGGHLTSADTQTNWNGITGRMELQFFSETYVENVQAYTDVHSKTVKLNAKIVGKLQGNVHVSAQSFHSSEHRSERHTIPPQMHAIDQSQLELIIPFGEKALLWSEHEPNLYRLLVKVVDDQGQLLDQQELVIGLRSFKANGNKLTINGRPTFLRGKHDGLIFPLTGYAPTTTEQWLEVLNTAKEYGINHYRFHTCCPPKAAFEAADLLGIYMEPELPFWGTISEERTAEQQYLIEEGYRMLREYGNHPSFVMMSLGNELWGSKQRLNEILAAYKAYDRRHLYTQGSNNFQFVPDILEEEDFFCGVRFSRDRLFRGSYAMCDAPLGHVQTDYPSTMKDYDAHIRSVPEQKVNTDSLIKIQYGTEVRTVEAEVTEEPLNPSIPVISHEIGQYSMYPNYDEIKKYSGSLKARNLEVFKQRLAEKGMLELADAFFTSSGKLAVACYKEELEAAFRSRELAGFQLLDLQDFSGQGTALVGVLDAFMDSKGLIEPNEWRQFCSDAVLLARFDRYHYATGGAFTAKLELCYYRPRLPKGLRLNWSLKHKDEKLDHGAVNIAQSVEPPYIEFGQLSIKLPNVERMTKVTLELSIDHTDIMNSYDLWIYPEQRLSPSENSVPLFHELTDDALALLEAGENIILMPKPAQLMHAIEGQYCTDFWNYPMFRSISENMNKPKPVGTLGLLIDHQHPALAHFESEQHSTYPWWTIVTYSSSIIMDRLPQQLKPIVQTIDNVERNYKLGLLFECRVKMGNVLVIAANYESIVQTVEGKHFLNGIFRYAGSEDFQPEVEVELDQLRNVLTIK